MISKYILRLHFVFLFIIPQLAFGQDGRRIFTDFNQQLSMTDLITYYSTPGGGGSGYIEITDDKLKVYYYYGFSTSFIRVGNLVELDTDQKIPDIYLGRVKDKFDVSIENNWLRIVCVSGCQGGSGYESSSTYTSLDIDFEAELTNKIIEYTNRGGYYNDAPFQKENVQKKIMYFDGLGRNTQTVFQQNSPNGLDVYLDKWYDKFGRLSKEYLPIVEGDDGAFKNRGLEDYQEFYSGNSTIANTSNPYTLYKYEENMLDRNSEIAFPGDSYHEATNNTKRFEYALNTDEDRVMKWSFLENNVYFGSNFGEGELYKKIEIDEDDNKTIIFENSEGQQILSRRVISDTDYTDTYYVYDHQGNLLYVLPPEFISQYLKYIWDGEGKYIKKSTLLTDGEIIADEYFIESTGSLILRDITITANSTYSFRAKAINENFKNELLNDYSFQYKYDKKNRMIKKKTPGSEWVFMVYDGRDRLVLTQDGNSRMENVWFFSKFDKSNRPIITGIYKNENVIGQLNMQSFLDNFYHDHDWNDNIWYEEKGGGVYNYTNRSFPEITNLQNIHTITYFDNYNFSIGDGKRDSKLQYHDAELGVVKTNSVRGFTTGGFIKILNGPEEGEMIGYKLYYDQKGNVIQNNTETLLGDYSRISSKINFYTGNLEHLKTEYLGLPSGEVIINERYEYDHADRMTAYYHQVNNNPEIKIASYNYNETGELIEKNLGDDIQSIDFRYNARGWLTTINGGGNSFDDELDLFGMQIMYHDAPGGYKNYNGNIGAIKWRSIANSGDDDVKEYRFTYNNIDRLLSAEYNDGMDNPDAYSVPQIEYDKNGNILGLERKINGNDADLLEYYYNGNQLTRVEDSYDDNLGFIDRNSSIGTNEYSYDSNGNLKKDDNKEITNIAYNHLNLPERIVFETDKWVEYTYDATGLKLQRRSHNGGNISVTDYINGLQVQDGSLDFVKHAEGHFDFSLGYHYNITDHLGNVRITVNQSGVVTRRDDYYPFGLTFNNYQESSSIANNYKYNGKEEQEETGWYDYGARMYIPEIGRWNGIDPLAEDYFQYSPYNYALNSPINSIDPNGMNVYIIIGGEAMLALKDDKDHTFYGQNDNGDLVQLEHQGKDRYSIGNALANSSKSTIESLGQSKSGEYQGTQYNTLGDYMSLIGMSNAQNMKNTFNDNADLIFGLGALRSMFRNGVKWYLKNFADEASEITISRSIGAATRGSLELTKKGRQILGNLSSLKDLTLRNGVKIRGGKAGNLNVIGEWLHDMPITEVANLAAKGNKEASTAIKILKQASKKAQKY